MKEIWKDIVGYEGLYQVSDKGRVRSLSRKQEYYKRKTVEKILSGIKNTKGYIQISLYKNGKNTIKHIHRLVAITFIENIHNKPTVNHKDGNKENNIVDNLEWATYAEQNTHKFKVLGNKHSKLVIETFRKNNIKKVNQLDIKTNKVIKVWKSMKSVQDELGYHYTHISKCCRNIRKTAYGYGWEYA